MEMAYLFINTNSHVQYVNFNLIVSRHLYVIMCSCITNCATKYNVDKRFSAATNIIGRRRDTRFVFE